MRTRQGWGLADDKAKGGQAEDRLMTTQGQGEDKLRTRRKHKLSTRYKARYANKAMARQRQSSEDKAREDKLSTGRRDGKSSAMASMTRRGQGKRRASTRQGQGDDGLRTS